MKINNSCDIYSSIVGYHLDDENDWVAELACQHFQHVRHKPPFINRPWVVTEIGRKNMLGHKLKCIKCKNNAPIDTLSSPNVNF